MLKRAWLLWSIGWITVFAVVAGSEGLSGFNGFWLMVLFPFAAGPALLYSWRFIRYGRLRNPRVPA